MNRVHQLVAGFLALCIAFAGAVGVSPLLHQLVEHGGRGAAHVHAGGNFQHDHGDGRVHEHPPVKQARQYARSNHALAHQEFTLPNISLGRLLHGLSALLNNGAPASSKSSAPHDDPGHTHHSLPQMLAGGMVEQHLDVSLLQFTFAPTGSQPVTCSSFPPLRDWEAQTASRAPPSARG